MNTLRDALAAYLRAQCRMLDKWADGDDGVKRGLWRDLHACEEAGRAALHLHPVATALQSEVNTAWHAEQARLKAAYEKRLEERSEELAEARDGEDCVYNYATVEVYKLSCGCRFERRLRKWVFECEAHE